MSRPKKKSTGPGPSTPAPPESSARPGRPTGGRLWAFRIGAFVVVPLLLLVLAEAGLRLAGYGYPTGFLQEFNQSGKKLFVQNGQFGWRFFGPAMAREPDPFAFPVAKPPRTIRVLVLGESAAFGDPQPAFGLARMLQAILEKRHPGVRFEVINTAITGINSNVILPIARDSISADADVWVVYMGNNEVVGPFGSGTVFGPQAPSLALIRASLALKSTRLGELLDAIRRRLHPPLTSKSEWGGMEMFLDHQVRADDPRMAGVYRNFAGNLADIIRAGRRGGAGVVVSTVAVNLRDCAPFASSNRPSLSAADKSQWEGLYVAGCAAQEAGRPAKAIELFRNAAKTDDSFAELRFREAQCDLGIGDVATARTNFLAARDLDTLRFRCDTKLNDIIRSSVPAQDSHVLLADAEQAFAKASSNGIPGQDYFYEHVHLTFTGNYRLALSIAPQVEKLLPANIAPAPAPNAPWPTIDDCAQRLAWGDWSFQVALAAMLQRLADPPFTAQITHNNQVALYTQVMRELTADLASGSSSNRMKICAAAASAAPDDPCLQEELAGLKQDSGDLPGAEAAARRSVELLPSSGADWSRLGLILGRQKQLKEAAAAFQRAIEIDPQDVWSRCNLGRAYWQDGRHEDGIKEYRLALKIKPRFGPGWQGLGNLLEASGDKTESEYCYRLAVKNRVHQPAELVDLATMCRNRGWLEDAAQIFDEASQLSPADGNLFYEGGMVIVALEQKARAAGQQQGAATLRRSAAEHFAKATQLAPGLMQAHFMYGSECDDAAIAEQQFSEAVRLAPGVIQARINLVLALQLLGKWTEADQQVDEILRRDPANAQAQQLKRSIQEKIDHPTNPQQPTP